MTTICAISTAVGGAIGIVRVSGPDAIQIVDSIFVSASGRKLPDYENQSLAYGNIMTDDGQLLDEVLVSVFRKPHSYTGEDSVEISCHGSTFILQQVVQLLLNHGCFNAQPGEFTKRAFLNGRMDLSQAEAVADLIASTNVATHRLAMSQMRGGFSKELRRLRDQLLEMTSLLELELDFSEEDVEFADRSKLLSLSDEISAAIKRLTDSFDTGNAIRNGIPVAIIGETNVGKSTLLNQLLHDDKAIVSDIHGTTRDAIEDCVTLRGVNFRFIDTAGLRHTDDVVENMGIERTYDRIKNAQIVLWLVDATSILKTLSSPTPQPVAEKTEPVLENVNVEVGYEQEEDKVSNNEQETQCPSNSILEIRDKIIPLTAGKTLIVVINKCDAIPDDQLYDIYNFVYTNSGINENETIRISAKNGDNISALTDMLIEAANKAEYSNTDIIVTNVRHYEALVHAGKSLQAARQSLDQDLPTDLVSEDLRDCLRSLGDILGEFTTDETLELIFSRFCVGK
ncbi:MAG: tRNA uridine-5-carboxymethylaminomethyl(34) synthesis GTPase MnmE [Bacteroidaceae bacterium]|nr:tRNA uridine-5-carboxymethylaminomethyl(34) synthesis GTPase MnmE [Bacteroidaceae bacterium]